MIQDGTILRKEKRWSDESAFTYGVRAFLLVEQVDAF